MNTYEFSKKNLNKYRFHLQQDLNSENIINNLIYLYKINLKNSHTIDYEILNNNQYIPLNVTAIISLRESIKNDIENQKISNGFFKHTQYLTDKVLYHTIDLLIAEKTLRISPHYKRSLFKII